jgi:hypothetical protein
MRADEHQRCEKTCADRTTRSFIAERARVRPVRWECPKLTALNLSDPASRTTSAVDVVQRRHFLASVSANLIARGPRLVRTTVEAGPRPIPGVCWKSPSRMSQRERSTTLRFVSHGEISCRLRFGVFHDARETSNRARDSRNPQDLVLAVIRRRCCISP